MSTPAHAQAGTGIELFEGSSVAAFLADSAGKLLGLNVALRERIGGRSPATVGELISDLDAARWQRLLTGMDTSPTALLAPAALTSTDGKLDAVELRLCKHAALNAVVGLIFPLLDRQQEAAVNLLQRDVLESVALGRPLRSRRLHPM